MTGGSAAARIGRWIALLVIAALASACSTAAEEPPVAVATSTPAPAPTATATPAPPPPSPTPAASPSPTPSPGSIGAGGPLLLIDRPDDAECGEPRFASFPGVPPPDPWNAPPFEHDPELEALLASEASGSDATVSISVIDLAGGRIASHDGERSWYAASLYKLTVLVEVLRQADAGVFDLDALAELRCYYVEHDLGTLEWLGLEPGDRLSIGEAARLMTAATDTALAVMLYDVAGGGHIQALLGALGLTDTGVLTSELPTTANDLARLLAALGSGQPTPEVGHHAMQLLQQQQFRARIPAGIPADGSLVGNKTGDLGANAHDIALIDAPFGRYTIAILTSGASDATFQRIAAAVHEYLAAVHAGD